VGERAHRRRARTAPAARQAKGAGRAGPLAEKGVGHGTLLACDAPPDMLRTCCVSCGHCALPPAGAAGRPDD